MRNLLGLKGESEVLEWLNNKDSVVLVWLSYCEIKRNRNLSEISCGVTNVVFCSDFDWNGVSSVPVL